MTIQFGRNELGTGPEGLEINVEGFQHDPTSADSEPTQIYVEIYEGKLRVHVWDGSSEDPRTVVIDTGTTATSDASNASSKIALRQ